MDILLSDFSYYFSVTGTEGGLHLMQLKFDPLSTPSPDVDDMKEAVRRTIEQYTNPLDAIYGDLIEGEKKPSMTDTPTSIDTGYHYNGRLTQRGIDMLPQRLQAICGESAVAPCGTLSVHETQRVKIQCSLTKRGNGFSHFSMKAEFQMSHILNVCFFRFTERLEGLTISDSARADMAQLNQTLHNTMDRGDTDYYQKLIGG